MKKLFALLIAVAMLVSVMPTLSFADAVTPTLDSLIGNELANGTFEAGIDGWTATGTEASAEIANTSKNSAGAMKLTGAGSVETTVQLYAQELYDVKLWVKPVSGNTGVTVNVRGKEVINGTVNDEGVLEGKLRFDDGTVKSGAAVSKVVTLDTKSPDLPVIITVSGDCYIDDVIIKISDEKIVNATSADDLGYWKPIGTGTVSYAEVKKTVDGQEVGTGEYAMKMTGSKNANAVQYIAVEKGESYTVTAKIYRMASMTGNNLFKYYWSDTNPTVVYIKAASVPAEEWTEVTQTFTNSYPTDGEPGDLAGIYFSLASNITGANYYLKDVSIKKTNLPTAAAAPSISALTLAKGDGKVNPSWTGSAPYYMYKYSVDGEVVTTGFTDTVPGYTINQDFEGTVALTLTPVNAEGLAGASLTSEIEVKSGYDVTAGTVNKDSLVKNGTVNVSVNVENNTDTNGKFAVIAAYYENGVMLACDLLQQDITSNGDKDYNLTVALTADDIVGGGQFNIFVWKSYDGNIFSMIPVSDIINPVVD